jgi:Cu(I)/Ag(I) efflux system membrane fusion protein
MAGPAPLAHRGEATVEAVDKDEITLSHGPIATLKWPAMTMAFKLPHGGLPLRVAAGDRVNFEFVQQADGSFQVTSMTPASAPTHQHGEQK